MSAVLLLLLLLVMLVPCGPTSTFVFRRAVDAAVGGGCTSQWPITASTVRVSCLARMQVMSMVPETNLDAKCFKDAPVPVAEREFLING